MLKGSHHTEESRIIIGERGIGRIPWNRGIKMWERENTKSIEKIYHEPIILKELKFNLKTK
jgi:hypothetical protein